MVPVHSVYKVSKTISRGVFLSTICIRGLSMLYLLFVLNNFCSFILVVAALPLKRLNASSSYKYPVKKTTKHSNIKYN